MTSTFYQNPIRGNDLIFSGEFSGSPTPNFTLEIVLDHFRKYNVFHFYLRLKNGIALSISREFLSDFVEIAEVRDIGGTFTMVKSRYFKHDGYGVMCLDLDEFPEFVQHMGNIKTPQPKITGGAG